MRPNSAPGPGVASSRGCGRSPPRAGWTAAAPSGPPRAPPPAPTRIAGDSGRCVQVGRAGRVADQQRPQIVDAVSSSAATRRTSPSALTSWAGAAGSRRVRPPHRSAGPDGQLDRARASRRQFQAQRSTPADASASVGGGCAVTAECAPPDVQRIPESWTLAAVRPGAARGHRAQLRQVGAEGDLHRQPQRPGRRAAQGDPLGAVRVPQPLDGDLGVGTAVRRGADHREEAGTVGRYRPALHGDRVAARHPQLAAESSRRPCW